MKRILVLLAALFLSLTMCASATAREVEFEVYVYDPCGGCGKVGVGCKSCTIIDEITNRYRLLFPDLDVRFQFHNLRMDNTQETSMWERVESFGLQKGELALPLLFVEDGLFAAEGSMDTAIADYLKTGDYPGADNLVRWRAGLASQRVPGRVVYLYSAYCEDCRDITRWLNYSLPKDYELVKYDIYTEVGQAMEHYILNQLGLPESEYCIPCVLYGDECFAGKKAIYLSLKSRIQEHPDLRTTVLEEFEDE